MPIFTGNIVYGLLVGLLVATWFGFGSNNRYGNELGYHNYPERMAAYEEMWGREESELWGWLEERVGLERLNGEPNAAMGGSGSKKKKQLAPDPRVIQEKMREDRMSEREILEAIRVTEEKLRLLKGVVGREDEKEGAVELP